VEGRQKEVVPYEVERLSRQGKHIRADLAREFGRAITQEASAERED